MPVSDNHHAVILLQGIPQLLSTLFYKTAHEQTAKGSVFEEAFRQGLGELGFAVEHGELKSLGGLCRELDAGVVKGEKMYLFECVSIERPMDSHESPHFCETRKGLNLGVFGLPDGESTGGRSDAGVEGAI